MFMGMYTCVCAHARAYLYCIYVYVHINCVLKMRAYEVGRSCELELTSQHAFVLPDLALDCARQPNADLAGHSTQFRLA